MSGTHAHPSRTILNYCAPLQQERYGIAIQPEENGLKELKLFIAFIAWTTVGHRCKPDVKKERPWPFSIIAVGRLKTRCIKTEIWKVGQPSFSIMVQHFFLHLFKSISNAPGTFIASPRGRVPPHGRRANALDDVTMPFSETCVVSTTTLRLENIFLFRKPTSEYMLYFNLRQAVYWTTASPLLCLVWPYSYSASRTLRK